MADETNNPVPSTPNVPVSGREGEEPSTQAGSVDLADHKDRGLVREAVRRRWPVPDEFVVEAVGALRGAMQISRENGKVGDVVDCVRTLTVIMGQNQTDDHLRDKNDRLDAGKPTENIQGVRIIVPGINSKSEEQSDGQ